MIVASLRHAYRLGALLRLLELPKSSYHYQIASEARPDRYAVERGLIREIFGRVHGRYGYRRIQAVLVREEGLCISGKTVLRLMAEEGCRCAVRRRRYRSYRGGGSAACEDRLKRGFSAERPNQKWVTDVTEFGVDGEKVYLSPMIDLFNGEVISYAVSTSPSMALVREMLEGAFPRLREGDRPICHSDQGWQYQQVGYRMMLENHGIEQSMSRKGNCLDNAAAESFFGHLKEEFYRGKRFESVDSFTAELREYIRWFNHDRIKLKLNGLSPVEYRTQSIVA